MPDPLVSSQPPRDVCCPGTGPLAAHLEKAFLRTATREAAGPRVQGSLGLEAAHTWALARLEPGLLSHSSAPTGGGRVPARGTRPWPWLCRGMRSQREGRTGLLPGPAPALGQDNHPDSSSIRGILVSMSVPGADVCGCSLPGPDANDPRRKGEPRLLSVPPHTQTLNHLSPTPQPASLVPTP